VTAPLVFYGSDLFRLSSGIVVITGVFNQEHCRIQFPFEVDVLYENKNMGSAVVSCARMPGRIATKTSSLEINGISGEIPSGARVELHVRQY
jgi:hypothetical protein